MNGINFIYLHLPFIRDVKKVSCDLNVIFIFDAFSKEKLMFGKISV